MTGVSYLDISANTNLFGVRGVDEVVRVVVISTCISKYLLHVYILPIDIVYDTLLETQSPSQSSSKWPPSLGTDTPI